MPWVWTDEIAAAIRDDDGVDPAMVNMWTQTPIAIQVAPDEAVEEVAARLGAVAAGRPKPAPTDSADG